MEHYTEKQYDDDLTVVADEYDDSFQTDNIDLFEFPSYDESPLARLKSLVLSIDWEITDDVLRQFNDELVDLKDIWSGEKIYLVYVQALEKISKYIYQEKADANPNAIKLLLALYYNLEKMVSSDSMGEEEKREMLLEDVKKFELLKKQIGREKKVSRHEPKEIYADEMQPPVASMAAGEGAILTNLKAIVLGIDWEITEVELERLRDEVHHLESIFSDSRPKQIFLQGLGTLAAYIRLKKSDAHPDAFKLLHSFFAGLEKISSEPMTFEEEKAVLFPEVEKFNAFKAIVGSKIKPSRDEDEEAEEYDEEEGGPAGSLAPALSGFAEEEERGFQEEEEAAALGIPSTAVVEDQIDRFFSEEDELRVDEMGGGRKGAAFTPEEPVAAGAIAGSRLEKMFQAEAPAAFAHVDQEIALQGVNVETEADDDSGEERLPLEAGELAPALATLDEAPPVERRGGIQEPVHSEFAADVESRLDDFFKDFDVLDEKPVLAAEPEPAAPATPAAPEPFVPEVSAIGESAPISDRDAALQGVNVETEDDDDSGEEPLAFLGEDLAPALAEEEDFGTPAGMAPAGEISVTPALTESETEPTIALDGQLEGFEEEIESVLTFEEQPAEEEAAAEEIVAFEEQPGLFGAEEETGIAFDERLEEVQEEIAPAFAFGEQPEKAEIAGEPALALEEQLDAFFAIEEEEPAGQEEVAAPLESIPMEPEHREAEQPPSSMFVMEVLEEAGEEEVVFELAEEEEVPAPEPFMAVEQVEPEEIQLEEDLFMQETVPAEGPPEIEALFAPEEEEAAGAEPEFLAVPEEAAEEGFEVELQEEESEYAAIFEAAEEPVPEEMTAAELMEDELSLAPSLTATAEDLFVGAAPEEEATAEEEVETEEEFLAVAAETPLAGLRACVSSLGLSLDDGIFQGMYAEINALRGRYFSSPVAKTFLQLLSTVTQHIDTYRYESSSEAFGILQSVTAAFEEAMADLQGVQVQETLLREMTKVLLWQKDMLDRQAVSKGEERTFAASVRTDAESDVGEEEEISFVEEEIADEFPEGFEPSGEGAVVDEQSSAAEFPADFGSAPYAAADEALIGDEPAADAFAAEGTLAMDEEDYASLEQELAGELLSPEGGETTEDPLATQLRDIIRDEMDVIRRELQESLEHLRKEMLDKEGR